MCTYMYVYHMYECMHASMYVCMCVCTYVCSYVYMYVNFKNVVLTTNVLATYCSYLAIAMKLCS